MCIASEIAYCIIKSKITLNAVGYRLKTLDISYGHLQECYTTGRSSREENNVSIVGEY